MLALAALALYGNDGRALFLLCVFFERSRLGSRLLHELALRRYEPAAMFTHSRGRWNEKPGMTLAPGVRGQAWSFWCLGLP